MKKDLLTLFSLTAMLCLISSAEGIARTPGERDVAADTSADVTFQVDMRIQMLEGKFAPSQNDSVWVRGNFNNWGTWLLADPNNDSIYTNAFTVDSLYNNPTRGLVIGDELNFKYYKTLREGSDWEGDPNRTLVVDQTPISTPVDYFNRDSVYTPPVGNVNVTFQVDMRIKLLETTFRPESGDIVTARGSFNNWGDPPVGNLDTLKDLDGDSIYTKTFSLPGNSAINYKFWKTLRGGIDYESGSNRSFNVGATDATIPSDYFDRDSAFTPPVSANVTFQVNMSVKILELTFRPDLGDIVTVRGSINGWGDPPVGNLDTLKDLDGDSIYTKTFSLLEGQNVHYKFWKTQLGYEGGTDHSYDVPIGGGTTPAHYFDGDTIINAPISANINWRVDMTAYEQLGWFLPSGGDSLQVRGPFNGWGGTPLTQNPFNPSQYRVTLPYSGTAYDDVPFKFYIQLDPSTAESRFPGFGTNNDGVRYEHPGERGDGNRILNVSTGGNLSSPSFYFSDINPGGVIPDGDTVTVTLTVNMGPATRHIINFDPATDTVYLVWQDALSRFNQVRI
ncbi:MAG TPA: hypothetical protein VGR15_01735, partial [Bacteroidota bacterium]|nr:hypothetical protein [Bacteroidota bacterium]